MIFSVVAVEILPDVMKKRGPFFVAVGFSAGVLAMLLLRVLTRKAKGGQKGDSPWSLLGATGAMFLLMDSCWSSMRRVLTLVLVASPILLGGLGGALLLRNLPSSATESVLSFGIAALLYLVTEELLVEAHEAPETSLGVAAFLRVS